MNRKQAGNLKCQRECLGIFGRCIYTFIRPSIEKPIMEYSGQTSGQKRLIAILAVVFFAMLIPQTAAALTWKIKSLDSAKAYTSIAVDSSAYPHIGFGGDAYTRLDDERWHFDYLTMRTGKTLNIKGTTLALDANGYPHLFYIEEGVEDFLVYAYFDGSKWVFDKTAFVYNQLYFYPSLVLDPAGHPHMTFPNNYSLQYKYFDGTAWHSEILDMLGGSPSQLKLDSDGNPNMAFRALYGRLGYSRKKDGSWEKGTVSVGIDIDNVSLALDGEDQAHILVCGENGLMHMWNLRINDSGLIYRYTYQMIESGVHVPSARISIDGEGFLHVAFCDKTHNQIKYGFNNGSGWQIEVVDQMTEPGRDVDMAIDGKKRIHLSYFDESKGELKYACSVSDYYPDSQFSVSSGSGEVPHTVQFTDESTGNINSWMWDFGDGHTSTDQNPAHTYLSPGNCDVKLTVAGPGGVRTRVIRNGVWNYRLPENEHYRAYVGKTGSFPLMVVDCQTHEIMYQVGIPEPPSGVAATQNGRYVYMTQTNLGLLLKYYVRDPEKAMWLEAISGIKSLALSPGDQYVYVATQKADNYFIRFDTIKNDITYVPLFNDTEGWSYGPAAGITVTPDGRSAFVGTSSYTSPGTQGNNGPWVLQVLDPAGPNPELRPIYGGGNIWAGIRVSPDNRYLYIGQWLMDELGQISVLPIDDLRPFRIRKIPLSAYPRGLAVSPDGKWLYAALQSDVVAIIDTSTNSVVRHISVTWSPSGIAFTPDGKKAFVCSMERVTVIDVEAQSTIDRIQVGIPGTWEKPYFIAIARYPVTCDGDFDLDSDVDGCDLADLAANPGLLDLDIFADDFGRTDCP